MVRFGSKAVIAGIQNCVDLGRNWRAQDATADSQDRFQPASELDDEPSDEFDDIEAHLPLQGR